MGGPPAAIAATGSQNNGGSYQVVVSNCATSVTSGAASLRITGVSVVVGQPGGMGYADGPGVLDDRALELLSDVALNVLGRIASVDRRGTSW